MVRIRKYLALLSICIFVGCGSEQVQTDIVLAIATDIGAAEVKVNKEVMYDLQGEKSKISLRFLGVNILGSLIQPKELTSAIANNFYQQSVDVDADLIVVALQGGGTNFAQSYKTVELEAFNSIYLKIQKWFGSIARREYDATDTIVDSNYINSATVKMISDESKNYEALYGEFLGLTLVGFDFDSVEDTGDRVTVIWAETPYEDGVVIRYTMIFNLVSKLAIHMSTEVIWI